MIVFEAVSKGYKLPARLLTIIICITLLTGYNVYMESTKQQNTAVQNEVLPLHY